MGNEAIARGALEAGCTLAASYPGTPASEILEAVFRMAREEGYPLHAEWSINEKVAFEVALANSYCGRRSLVSMKQVGLNVALDPFMSAAYTGVKGGFVVVSADDPGPYSSQTEQDSRLAALAAGVPVLDPAGPREALAMTARAFEISERYRVPVMVRPTTRVCHARQGVPCRPLPEGGAEAFFQRDPKRWAATPRYRLTLHRELAAKLVQIAAAEAGFTRRREGKARRARCIVSSGVAWAYVVDVLADLGCADEVELYRAEMPFPLDEAETARLLETYEQVLVVEETAPVIEYQLRDRSRVRGRLSRDVPAAGELAPEVVYDVVTGFLDEGKGARSSARAAAEEGEGTLREQPQVDAPTAPPSGPRPRLCAGCGHRAAFYAMRQALPGAIYPGDIGCYTLGLNLGAVDTVLCMGASISQAAGFYWAHQGGGREGQDIAATIGDSTFLHTGLPALLNAEMQGARFIVVILDNSCTAMTGYQPTLLTQEPRRVEGPTLESLARACGVRFVRVVDAYDVEGTIEALKAAREYTRVPEGGVAVVISRHPCIREPGAAHGPRLRVRIDDNCIGCRVCAERFECPAFVWDEAAGVMTIDQELCNGCGVCRVCCPVEAIVVEEEE